MQIIAIEFLFIGGHLAGGASEAKYANKYVFKHTSGSYDVPDDLKRLGDAMAASAVSTSYIYIYIHI